MIVKIFKENLISLCSQEAIEEYSVNTLEIYLHDGMSAIQQRNLVIHSVIENFCKTWSHDKVEELEDLIVSSLDEL